MWKIELEDGVASIPREDWNALAAGESPFLDWDWLASLEHAETVGPATGWLAKPLVARDGERLVAACPLYVKNHSEGEFVFDWGWADAAERAGISYYPKLLVGVPFTPVAGARFLIASGEDRVSWVHRFGAALRELCDGNDLSGVHVNFTRQDETEPLRDEGYLLRIGFQYHWHNHGYRGFDDYLARFRSKRRTQIRRERREMDDVGVRIEALAGDTIDDALFEPMYRFYRSTVDAHFYGRPYLNRHFFELLRERFKHRLCLVVARQGDEIIAGTTNVEKDGVLYGRYWGATRPLRHLHFNVCYYAAIEHCIEAGLTRFEPGAGGDYKYLRGFDAQATYSLHYLREPRLAQAVERFLESERAEASRAIEQLRDRSVLKNGRRKPA
ncbi:MAG: GNAT family N-acetyltransferase [Myxococcota bacterium]